MLISKFENNEPPYSNCRGGVSPPCFILCIPNRGEETSPLQTRTGILIVVFSIGFSSLQ